MLSLDHPIIPFVDKENDLYLSYLETMGFITTLDDFNKILVKVHGLNQDEEGHFFCIGECHD